LFEATAGPRFRTMNILAISQPSTQRRPTLSVLDLTDDFGATRRSRNPALRGIVAQSMRLNGTLPTGLWKSSMREISGRLQGEWAQGSGTHIPQGLATRSAGVSFSNLLGLSKGHGPHPARCRRKPAGHTMYRFLSSDRYPIDGYEQHRTGMFVEY